MSNVLIGIIGVILFIGLALAGALFLGPRFQESTNNAKASAMVQAISQTASAANMYTVQNGSDLASSAVTSTSPIVTSGYLKSVPRSLTGLPETDSIYLDDASALPSGAPSVLVLMKIGNDATAKAVCESIERQTGRITATQSLDTSARSFALANLTGTAGCQSNGVNYWAFQKI